MRVWTLQDFRAYFVLLRLDLTARTASRNSRLRRGAWASSVPRIAASDDRRCRTGEGGKTGGSGEAPRQEAQGLFGDEAMMFLRISFREEFVTTCMLYPPSLHYSTYEYKR